MCWRLSFPFQTTPHRRVSSIPSHGGPSHQSQNSNINHEAPTVTQYYENYGQHASGEGTININPQTTSYQWQYIPSDPLEELKKHCSPSAAFDSSARFDPPRCAESTRLRIIQTIEEWINSDGDNAVPSSLFWLHGGAGVGKSALAQSLSEKYQKKRQLAASFFFFRSDAARSNGDCLIPTLVSQLVDTFNGIAPFVRGRIRENPTIFSKRCQTQIDELLIGPLLALKSKPASHGTHPRLIVIDGLDECQNPDIQCELLRVIARAVPSIPYPIRFFVTSRPEAHITDVFDHDRDVQAIPVLRYDLGDDPDADVDICKFLEEEFAEVRRVHRLGQHLPDWPPQEAIISLVQRSSRHFIYAATAIRYIRSPKHRPDDRLEIVLSLRPPQEEDRPYADLDALYALIFGGVESRSQLEKICLVLGVLYFQSKKVGFFVRVPVYPNIEELLGMKAGNLVLLLDPILSLVSIDGEAVQILHKSLFDYLLDSNRGGHLPFDLARVHELAANYILEERIMEGTCDLGYFRIFAYHCQYACLNDTLKGYLQCLDVPFPRSVMNTPKTFPPWGDDLNLSLGPMIWRFFRTLSRVDFDSTGQLHEQYLTKWAGYLHSAVPRRTLSQNGTIFAKVDDWKCKLDKLFVEWKPAFKPMDAGTDSDRRVAFIKKEHSVLSAYAKAAFSGDANAMASSLVFGDSFIHGYNFGIWDEHSLGFLSLQTYSRHGNTSYPHLQVGRLDIVHETLNYLRTIEKYLFSDLYQKYGLEPDESTPIG